MKVHTSFNEMPTNYISVLTTWKIRPDIAKLDDIFHPLNNNEYLTIYSSTIDCAKYTYFIHQKSHDLLNKSWNKL